MYMECSGNPSDILSCSFFAADAAHLNGTGLDRSLDLAMDLDSKRADFGEGDVLLFQRKA